MSFYLDNSATTPLHDEITSYLKEILNVFGNPSSSHSKGVYSKQLIEEVRKKTVRFINANLSDDIIFTSSASASNTLGIQGYALFNVCTILYPKTLHKSALKTIEVLSKYYHIGTSILDVDCYGNINIEFLKQEMQKGYTQKLVVLDYANSEIGTIQNVKEIVKIVHQYNGKVFVDCTGSISSIPLDVSGLNIDMASFSAHKIGALKGVGVLYKKEDIKLSSLIHGTQEQGLFAGTENILGILSLGKAIDLINYDSLDKMLYNRNFVWDKLKNIDDVYLIGAPLKQSRLLNNLFICIKGTVGSELVAMMDDMFDTQISTGSACDNGSLTPSSVLLAIGTCKDDVNSCIRISFSGKETEEELAKFCENLHTCIKMIRDFFPDRFCESVHPIGENYKI